MTTAEKIIPPEITSSERVLTALRHKEPDVLPVDIGGTRISGIHEKAYREYRRRLGLPPAPTRMMVRYLQIPAIDEDFRLRVGVDIESINPDTARYETETVNEKYGAAYMDRWQCKWRMPEEGNYFDSIEHPLAGADTAADLEKFAWPVEDADGLFEHFPEEVDVIQNRHKRTIVLGRTAPGIFEMTGVLCGMEKSLIDMALNPGFSEALMDRILETKLVYYKAAVRRLLDAGAEYFIAGESDDLGTQDSQIMSLEMYRRFVKPRHSRLFKAIKDLSGGRAFIELHCCGSVGPLLPDLIESGVEIINPVQVNAKDMDDTAALKKWFGKDIVFHGGGVDSQRTLPYGTPAEVADEVRRRIEDLAPGGGFIFTPVHSIQHDVPFENFEAMLKAVNEYRPIH
jgi:uroporphyrinogen decarboxylase